MGCDCGVDRLLVFVFVFELVVWVVFGLCLFWLILVIVVELLIVGFVYCV